MQFLGAQFLPGVCPSRQKAHLLAQRIHIIDRLGNMLVKNLHLKSKHGLLRSFYLNTFDNYELINFINFLVQI